MAPISAKAGAASKVLMSALETKNEFRMIAIPKKPIVLIRFENVYSDIFICFIVNILFIFLLF
jgi:hypothetical protein